MLSTYIRYINHQQTSPSSSGLSSQKRTKAYKSHQKSTSSMSSPPLPQALPVSPPAARATRTDRPQAAQGLARPVTRVQTWLMRCAWERTRRALLKTRGLARVWMSLAWRGIWTFWCGVSEWLLKISRTWEYKGCQPTCSWYRKSGCKCEQSIWPLKVCQEKVWWHPMAFNIHYSDTMVALRRVHSLPWASCRGH